MRPPELHSGIALFLDFDGTLVDIAPRPDAVVVPVELPDVLGDLSAFLGGALAVVSGRRLAEIDRHLAPAILPGSGSHGAEIRKADGSIEVPNPGISAVVQTMRQRLEDMFDGIAGVSVENKPYSAAIHYRGAPERQAQVAQAMQALVAEFDGWEVAAGKMVLEARPIGVSKARAVEVLMAAAPFAGRVPVFIGDDLTDEDGIKAVGRLDGYGVKVGPGDSLARYRLDNPHDVLNFLKTAAI